MPYWLPNSHKEREDGDDREWKAIKLVKRLLIGERWCERDTAERNERGSSNHEALEASCGHMQPIKCRLAKGARLWLAGRDGVIVHKLIPQRNCLAAFLPLSHPPATAPRLMCSLWRKRAWVRSEESQIWSQHCHGLGLKREKHSGLTRTVRGGARVSYNPSFLSSVWG